MVEQGFELGKMTPEVAEFAHLRALLLLGDPRPIIERYFKIAPEEQGKPLVPMLFSNEPNQEYYWWELFGKRMEAYRGALAKGLSHEEACAKPEIGLPWQMDVLCLKDRKARWSAFVLAVKTAKFIWVPGTHVFGLVDSEDTFTATNRFVETFYENTPGYARPPKSPTWGVERKVIVWPQADGGQVTSSFTLRTAANPNVGSGETPTDPFYDEYAKFPKTFSMAAQSSFRASLPADTPFMRGGTVGPDGADCAMYEEIQQIKRGERQTVYLSRTWFQNPANHLKSGSRDRRPADCRDEDIRPGVNAGPNGDKETVLVSQFPDDGIPVAWRLAWRRAKMRDALLAAGGPGNEDAANILFQREHCEDDESPWMIAGRSQFSRRLLELQAAVARSPSNVLVIDEPIEGLQLRAWQGYDPSHVYIFGMDFGSGSQGDDTSGQIFDFTEMTFIGEYHGNVTEPYLASAGAVKVMARFGNGVWVPERNRFPGIGNHIARTLRYPNVWRRPLRPGEKPDSESFRNRQYGFNAGDTHFSEKEPSVEELLGRFKAMFNRGAFKVLNPLLLTTMQRWNPDREKHCPDRIAGARNVLLGLDMARELTPVTGVVVPFRAPAIRLVQPERYSLYVAGR